VIRNSLEIRNIVHSFQEGTVNEIEAAAGRMEALMGTDVGRRITRLREAAAGDLYRAAAGIAGCKTPRVFIVTGFFVFRGIPPAAETDGPPGAVHLAGALLRMGAAVEIITDDLCEPAVQAAVYAAGINAPVRAVARSTPAVHRLLETLNDPANPFTHGIAIERAGPSRSGAPMNMRGESIEPFTAPLHLLFDLPRRARSYVTIGIGDGGNEIGMGKIPREVIAADVENGDAIACPVPCDHLLVCGVSNWGATALAAALALLNSAVRKQIAAHLTVESDRAILRAMVEHGPAVDGMLKTQSVTVDGIDSDLYERILRGIVGEIHGVLTD
jgi:hypothetical protein